jgi:hypothetical protein
MSSPYHYQPLCHDHSFRILFLHPAKLPNAPLSLELCETPLTKAGGKFDALSYVWGPPGNIEVLCSGMVITIGPNCEAALRRLRSRTRKCALFVDAICIDQSNDQEKEEQIKLMGKIYLSAKRVLIWLGRGSDKTDLAFKEIRLLYRFRRLLETKDHRPITSPRVDEFRHWVWLRTLVHDRTYFDFYLLNFPAFGPLAPCCSNFSVSLQPPAFIRTSSSLQGLIIPVA